MEIGDVLQLVWVVVTVCLVGTVRTVNTSHAYRAESQPQPAEHGDRTAADREQSAAVEGECTANDGEGSCFKADSAENRRDDTGMRGASSGDTPIRWDTSGYVTFCPCMGNFGNQVEQYLGSLAFAKAVNRTIILPPFFHITFRQRAIQRFVPFEELFKTEAIMEYHRAITMKDFLEVLAPENWPTDQRIGYMQKPYNNVCAINSAFWKDLSPPIEFSKCQLHTIRSQVDASNKETMLEPYIKWNDKFPSKDHPVLAFNMAIGTFPMLSGNRHLQKYFRWNEAIFSEARSVIDKTFAGDVWVAVHLRNGNDWDMCLPSLDHMLELIARVFLEVKAKHLYIATDKHHYAEEFQKVLDPFGAAVHYLHAFPHLDLMIMGQADYFIGNCVSSFTSFVKRERDAHGRPSIFWGQEYRGFQ